MIQFFSEEIEFDLQNTNQINTSLYELAEAESVTLDSLNYIFCSDDYLYKMNVQYLNHDTYTDIITFDQSEQENVISGDIFISIDRVKENAKEHSIPFINELLRVLAHGLLHLIGFGDKTDEEQLLMRKKEDDFLSLCDRNGLI